MLSRRLGSYPPLWLLGPAQVGARASLLLLNLFQGHPSIMSAIESPILRSLRLILGAQKVKVVHHHHHQQQSSTQNGSAKDGNKTICVQNLHSQISSNALLSRLFKDVTELPVWPHIKVKVLFERSPNEMADLDIKALKVVIRPLEGPWKDTYVPFLFNLPSTYPNDPPKITVSNALATN